MTGLTVIFAFQRASVWCKLAGKIQVLPPSFAENRDDLSALKISIKVCFCR